jgi:hypothetical protein
VSATYQREGFTVSLSVSPGGEPDTVVVSINNHGNVDLKQFPMPEGAKELYAFPATVAYVTEQNVDATTQECRRLLETQGWQWFGDTTVSFFVKQNAVRLQVMVSEAPGQGGKTVIQVTGEQLSVDLPIPPDLEWLQYADAVGGMQFDSRKSEAELVRFFIDALGAVGWKPTTQTPVKIDFRNHLIFRNPSQEMIEIQFYEVDGKTRGDVKYQTAAQAAAEAQKVAAVVAEAQRKRDAEIERKKNPPKVPIAAPAEARVAEQAAKSIEFSIPTGMARAAVARWIRDRQADGWTAEATFDTKEAGDFKLTKGPIELNVLFVDPGFIPGEITISVAGDYQLDLGE